MQSSAADIFKVNERLAFEKTLPDESYMAFDGRFVFGMTWACRLRKKATECCVFQECPVKPRDIRVSQIQTSFHAVDHNANRTSTKELKYFLESIGDRFEILPENWNKAGQSAVSEPHDEGINQARLAAACSIGKRYGRLHQLINSADGA
jgi:hypothetical protein